MVCYFNDYIGSISFVAFCNALSKKFCHREFFDGLFKILLLLLCCGLFWEFITPMYRKGSVTDLGDIVAYMSGGISYYFLRYKVGF